MKWTIRKKLFALTSTGLTALVVISILAYRSIGVLDHSMDTIVSASQALRHQMEADMMHDAIRGDVLASQLATDEEARKRASRDMNEHVKEFRAAMEESHKLAQGDLKKKVEEALPLLNAYVEAAEAAAAQSGRNRGKSGGELKQFLTAFAELETAMAQLSNQIEEGVTSSQAVGDTAVQQAGYMLWVGALLGLVVSGVISLVLARFIAGSVNNVVERIKDVAQGEGDLTKRLEANSQDELGDLAKWFNTFMEKLHGIMSQVSANTHRLASASEEISASASQQAQGSEQQKDQARQVATAMQEMSATVLQVSDNSNKASDAARKAAETAREGGKIVEHTLVKMRAIAESVGQTARKVQELGKSSDQIGEIIGVIDDIADQTNLLALNAAIEAARAGEQGRGFAVVADEVRKLAERTSKATKEIAQMIKSIQVETKAAVEAMQAGTKQVEEGVETTSHAGASLHEIIKMAEQVGEMITHIATAATEQASATEEVNNNLDQISKVTQEAAAGAQQSARAVHELSSLALDLQNLVSQFRLESNGQGQAVQASSGSHGGGRGSSKANGKGNGMFHPAAESHEPAHVAVQ